MPAPASTSQLLENLRKCGLVPPARLAEVVVGVGPDDDPRAVLDRCVAGGLLTDFQAERIAAGKYKGFVLGGYVILDRIGGGGMGQVYLAEHPTMRRHVAIKVLTPGAGSDPVAVERFMREARAAATLDHPNIIRVHDFRQDGGLLYLIMEYVPGVSLHHLVSRGGKLPVPAAADYARQVALGLQHAHEQGLVHRDVKPANLLVAADGAVKLLDLGLVRDSANSSSKLTSKLDKTILGTADFLAPEQAMDSSAVDCRADVYGLGATLYFLLAGHPMFPEGRTAQKLMWQQLKEPTPIRELRPDVPDGLAAVLTTSIRKTPADRFQTPAEFAAALAHYAPRCVPPDPDLLPGPPPRWGGAGPNPVSSGVGSAVSSALIELPPAKPTLTTALPGPTLDERLSSTPRAIPPDRRTPLLDEVPLLVPPPSGSVPEAPPWPVAPPPAPRGLNPGLAAGLLVAGGGGTVLALWLLGMLK